CNTPPEPPIYPPSLHDALPISLRPAQHVPLAPRADVVLRQGEPVEGAGDRPQALHRLRLRVSVREQEAERLIAGAAHAPAQLVRSEEHTSELQSREKLVCRLLL